MSRASPSEIFATGLTTFERESDSNLSYTAVGSGTDIRTVQPAGTGAQEDRAAAGQDDSLPAQGSVPDALACPATRLATAATTAVRLFRFIFPEGCNGLTSRRTIRSGIGERRRARCIEIIVLTDEIGRHQTTVMRLRLKLMTVGTTLVGLIPLLRAPGSGADVMKRIAAPMVGGLITSAFLTLEIIPVISTYNRGGERPSPPIDEARTATPARRRRGRRPQ